jgi:hypothetical protein
MENEMKKHDPEKASDAVAVTSRMMDAGSQELLRYDPQYEDPEDAAKRIFSAMMAARH